MRENARYADAIALYRQAGKKKEAKTIFQALAKTYNYREYDLYALTKQFNTKNNPLSIGAALSQQIAKRAFKAVKEYELKKEANQDLKDLEDLVA